MTILVTGAAGFIGYHTCRRLLQRGEHVIGIDNLNDYYSVQLKRDRLADLNSDLEQASRFKFMELDFSEAQALKDMLAPFDITSIVHLGAQAGVRYSLLNPGAYVQSNLSGHVNMLEIARDRRVNNFVYASSSSVYGQTSELPFRVENRTDWPISLYAATKRADELISETYAHLFRIPQTGLRFFTVYGPWGRPDMAVWMFTDKILKGQAITIFNHGKMQRDFTYIDDIISGVIAALDSPAPDDGAQKPGGSHSPHRIYNIGNNRSEELETLVSKIEAACGRKAERDYQPMQAGDVTATYADISAIERDLDYRPTTPISVGIPRWVEWFRAYHGV